MNVKFLSNKDGSMLSELRCLIGGASLVRVVMGFVRVSGINLLGEDFRRLCAGEREGELRVIVGSVPTQLSQEAFDVLGGHVKICPRETGGRLLHAKTWVIEKDGQRYVVVGSGNLTAGGLRWNFEQGVSFRVEPGSTESVRIDEFVAWFDGVWCGKATTPVRAKLVSETSCSDPDAPESVGLVVLYQPLPADPPRSNPTNESEREVESVVDTFERQTATEPEAYWWELPRLEERLNEAYDTMRDYQQDIIERMDGCFVAEGSDRAILELPTGSGKTRIAVWWLMKHFVLRGKSVCWIAETKELLDQARCEFEFYLDDGITSYYGKDKDAAGRVVLMSRQSLAQSHVEYRRPAGRRNRRRRHLYNPVDMSRFGAVCYDETHRALADKTWEILSRFQGKFLGLTATAFRASGDRAELLAQMGARAVLREDNGGIYDLQRLAEYVSLPRWEFLERSVSFPSSKIDRKYFPAGDGDFEQEVLDEVSHNWEWNKAICDHWSARSEIYGSTLIFASNIEHADALASDLAGRIGQDAVASLNYKTDRAARLEIMRRFRDGSLRVLVNVGICAEGVDFPELRTVVLARPTMSKRLYCQMIGRGTRKTLTKDSFVVLDCVGGSLIADFNETLGLAEQVEAEYNQLRPPT